MRYLIPAILLLNFCPSILPMDPVLQKQLNTTTTRIAAIGILAINGQECLKKNEELDLCLKEAPTLSSATRKIFLDWNPIMMVSANDTSKISHNISKFPTAEEFKTMAENNDKSVQYMAKMLAIKSLQSIQNAKLLSIVSSIGTFSKTICAGIDLTTKYLSQSNRKDKCLGRILPDLSSQARQFLQDIEQRELDKESIVKKNVDTIRSKAPWLSATNLARFAEGQYYTDTTQHHIKYIKDTYAELQPFLLMLVGPSKSFSEQEEAFRSYMLTTIKKLTGVPYTPKLNLISELFEEPIDSKRTELETACNECITAITWKENAAILKSLEEKPKKKKSKKTRGIEAVADAPIAEESSVKEEALALENLNAPITSDTSRTSAFIDPSIAAIPAEVLTLLPENMHQAHKDGSTIQAITHDIITIDDPKNRCTLRLYRIDEHKAQPTFLHHDARIYQWFENKEAALKTCKAKASAAGKILNEEEAVLMHTFARRVDNFLPTLGCTTTWKGQKEGDHILCMAGEVEYADGKIDTGIFVYAITRDRLCYHRNFTKKPWDELLKERVEKGFTLAHPEISDDEETVTVP